MTNLLKHFRLAITLSFLLLFSLHVYADRKALVIGNDMYQAVMPLKNARNDAALISGVLRKAGFNVTQANDLGRDKLWSTIDSFKAKLNKGDEVVFYFAGHGVQIGPTQLLLPIDIKSQNEAQLQRDGIPLIEVQDALKDARVAVFIIDACRDNPFPKQGTRSIGATRGLLPPEPSTGQIIVMSAGRNQKALDEVPGQRSTNGLFTWELAQVLQTPGLEVRAALERVKEVVDDKARQVNHEQRPSLVNDLRGNFYFIASSASASVQSAPIFAPLRQQSAVEAEQELWDTIKGANSAEALNEYLKEFPQGRFMAQARVLLAKLRAMPPPAPFAPQVTAALPQQPNVRLLADTSSTLAKLRSTNSITMGVRSASGVLSYALRDGQYAGFHVDLCREVIEQVKRKNGLPNLRIAYLEVTSQNRIPLVQNGTVDLECGSTTNNLARQKEVSFAVTTHIIEGRMAVKVRSGITSIAQLNGKNVAVTTGTTTAQMLRQNPRLLGMSFSEVFGKDHADSFGMLESGRADAFVMDDAILAGNIATSIDSASYRITGEVLYTEPVAIMMRKDDVEFKKIVDEEIRAMMADGRFERSYNKWFLNPIPPRNINLNLSMSESMRASMKTPNDFPFEAYARR